MGIGCVGEQTLCIKHVHLINAERHYLLLHAVKLAASADALQLHAQGIGQFAALGEELQADISNCLALNLAIYKYVIHIFSQ